MPYTDQGIGHAATDTSQQAAEAMQSSAATIRIRVLGCFEANDPMTADEVAEKLDMHPLTVRPRITELGNAGKLRDTGARRDGNFGRPQIVWGVRG